MRLSSWIVFILASMLIIWVSRRSLISPRSHGFSRFFAWELILGLVLFNLPVWFRQPLAWHQLISWPLLVISILLLIPSVAALIRRGKPAATRQENSLLAFEKTTRLVTTGLYHYIRHPLYSSLLFLAWGAFFKLPSWPGTILALAASLFLFLTARMEEAEDIRFFGPDYTLYMHSTHMFIPYLF